MASKERERNVNVGRDLETLNKHVTVMSSRFILLSRHDLWLGPYNKAKLTSHYRHWLKGEKLISAIITALYAATSSDTTCALTVTA